MPITSLRFLRFFATVLAAAFLLPKRLRNTALLAASCYFYYTYMPRGLAALAFSSLSSYLLAIAIERAREGGRGRRAKLLFIAAIAMQVALLCFFKYMPPVKLANISIIMPLGFSFYSFQILASLADVYMGRTRAERNFIDWSLFVSFFPKVIEGPIERSGFLSQLKSPPPFKWEAFREGTLRFFWGLFVKLVITQRLAVITEQVANLYIYMEGYQLAVGMLAYSLQLYTDFAAYSCMARGAGRMLGYELSGNFFQPYFATSIKDFWRRWHISLSSWLRDYIYIPLGGSRCPSWRRYLNVLATFLVSGIWHGASFKFVLWGLAHGLLQLAEGLLQPLGDRICTKLKVNRSSFSHRALLTLKTFLLVSVLWLLFFRDSARSAFDYLSWCLHFKNYPEIFEGGLLGFGLGVFDLTVLAIALGIFACHSVMAEKGTDCMEWLLRQGLWLRLGVYWTLMLLLAFSVTSSAKEFVYAAF